MSQVCAWQRFVSIWRRKVSTEGQKQEIAGLRVRDLNVLRGLFICVCPTSLYIFSSVNKTEPETNCPAHNLLYINSHQRTVQFSEAARTHSRNPFSSHLPLVPRRCFHKRSQASYLLNDFIRPCCFLFHLRCILGDVGQFSGSAKNITGSCNVILTWSEGPGKVLSSSSSIE